jgi:hypothetical protein
LEDCDSPEFAWSFLPIPELFTTLMEQRDWNVDSMDHLFRTFSTVPAWRELLLMSVTRLFETSISATQFVGIIRVLPFLDAPQLIEVSLRRRIRTYPSIGKQLCSVVGERIPEIPQSLFCEWITFMILESDCDLCAA